MFLLSFLFAFANPAAAICLSLLMIVLVGILYIYIIIRLILFMQACVIDDYGPVECFKKSWEVSRGNFILIFVTIIILIIINVAVNIPSIVLSNAGVPYASSIYNVASSIFLLPFFYITLTFLYLKLTRKPTPPQMTAQYQVHSGANQPPYNPQ